jgi:hypothetical protein
MNDMTIAERDWHTYVTGVMGALHRAVANLEIATDPRQPQSAREAARARIASAYETALWSIATLPDAPP